MKKFSDKISCSLKLKLSLKISTYFENQTVRLHVLYTFNIKVKFYVNRILFIIWSISLYFMYNFKLENLKFKQFIDGSAIDF